MPKPARFTDAALAALALTTLALSCGGEAPAPPPAAVPAGAAPAARTERADAVPLPPLPEPPRGLGSMTARLPGTTDVVGGVRLATHHATVTIEHGIAHTEVQEEFHNDTDRVLEGRLVLPVPADATLARLALWVGTTLVEGEVVERRRASMIFRGIVDDTVRPRDPALLDVVAGGKLSLKIFPLPARGARRVLFAYDEVLRADAGKLRYVHPLSLGGSRATPIDSLRVTVNGDVRLDARAVTPTEDLVVTLDDRPPSLLQAQRAGGEVTVLARTVATSPSPSAPVEGDVVVALDASEGQSGASMAAQLHLAAAVLDGLRPRESFALLACDTACRSYPERGLAHATVTEIDEARSFLAAVEPGGASDPAGALRAALSRLDQERRGQVLFASDGTATAGELSVDAQLAHVGALGVGFDVRVLGAGRAVDHASLASLARGLGATYDRVVDGSPLGPRVRALAASRRVAVVPSPEVALPPGFGDVEPARRSPVREGDEVVTLARGRAPVEGATTTRAPLAKLWARERVAALEARGPEGDAELVALSVSHHLLSRATALLVLENDRMFAEFGVARTRPEGVDTAPDATGDPAVGAGRLSGVHVTRPPSVRMGMTQVSGRLPPEVIQRIVRQNFGRFRLCYEDGLRRRPSLGGRVVTRFVLGRDGSVASVSDGGSDLDDPQVLACVRAAFSALSFPQPEGGIVTVVYPIMFASESGGAERPESAQRTPTPPTPPPRFAAIDTRLPRNSALNPPPWEPPPPEVATATHRAGDERWRAQDAAQLASLARAVEREPARRRAHLELVRGAILRGRFEDAHAAAARLAELDPELPEAREALAQTSALLGRGADAARATAMAAALDRRSVARQLAAARAALSSRDDTRACAHLRALGELSPTEHGARASACRRGEPAAAPPPPKSGFEVAWSCDDACAGLALITPLGRVISPWTAGAAGDGALSAPLVGGTYRAVALDDHTMSVELRALGATFRARRDAGASTVAVSEVRIPRPRWQPRVRW